MGLGKVILGIFGILLLLIAVVAVDGYLTYQTFNDLGTNDVSDLVSNPQFAVSGSNSEIVKVSVDVDLPSAGFIPKGVSIKLIVDFNGDVKTAEETVNLGDSKTLSLEFTLSTTNANTLANGGSLSVSVEADVTPQVFGFSITQATQNVDLGSQTITK